MTHADLVPASGELDAIAAMLAGARPRAVAALLRYFRDLDTAEEAFQEASLRALQHWPAQGPPRDPTAWLIFVGRNAALDELRRRQRDEPLPDGDTFADPHDDALERLAGQLDEAHYRDDLLRLLFVCCHPVLPATQQIALALRIVCGLSVREIARAFLVGEAAMEQRITRAKKRIATAGIPFDTPGVAERDARLATVCTSVYLLFNEGYSASGGTQPVRAPLCDEAIRLGRLLVQLFAGDAQVQGLLALMLLQHARTPARVAADGALVLLEAQDRRLWHAGRIAEGLCLVEQALRRGPPGPYPVQAAIAAVHCQAADAKATDWAEIARLYDVLERLQPSPVVTLNRAVAVGKVDGPAAALALIAPLAEPLADYFHFHGVRGALLKQLERPDEAREALRRAISLAHSAAEAAHIRAELDGLGGPAAPRGTARPMA